MGLIDNLKEKLDAKIQESHEVLELRKEEKEKFSEMGIEAYVQNIKETPKIYGKLNEENRDALYTIQELYQKHVGHAETFKEELTARKVAEISAGGLKKVLICAGAEIRYLKSKGKDINKSRYLKGANLGDKIFK